MNTEGICVEKFLQDHGVKPTPQRMVIAQYVLNGKRHPTADQVFQAVAEKLPVALSRATVYNTLNTLVGASAIKEVYLESGPARYDANIDEHHHFIDVKTGQVFNIDPDEVKTMAPQLGQTLKSITIRSHFSAKGLRNFYSFCISILRSFSNIS